MKRLHVVSDRNPANGMFVAASLIAAHEDGSRVVTCSEFLSGATPIDADCEVVVHGCWLPCYWKCCFKVLKLRAKGLAGSEGPLPLPAVRLVRMTHANLDPVRYRFHGWRKRLVSPIERWLFKKCDCVVVTCAEEQKWCEAWGVKGPFEVIDLKRFFKLDTPVVRTRAGLRREPLHVLYLGREHPLKGVRYLERAVREINEEQTVSCRNAERVELRVVSEHVGEALEGDWEWCDVLCLPTLSDNFGLVVAEALERGKRAITTDGAPAWEPGGANRWTVDGLIYLRGFRDGSDEERVKLLKDALSQSLANC